MKPERIEELMAHHDMVTGVASEALPSAAELLHLLRCARAWAELEQTLRGIAEDTGCAYPVTVTKKNPRSVQYEFGVADGHRVAAAKARAALARAKETA